jgi:hypothetical protein
MMQLSHVVSTYLTTTVRAAAMRRLAVRFETNRADVLAAGYSTSTP